MADEPMQAPPADPGVQPGDAVAMLTTELFFAQRRVDLKNADLLHGYLQKAGDVNYALQQGQYRPGDNFDPATDYPKVPASFVLGDPQGPFQFRYEEQTGPPVCPAVPMWQKEAAPPANNIDVGDPMAGAPGWFVVGPRDTFPVGQTTPPQADGFRYQKFGAVAGKGWYLQVK